MNGGLYASCRVTALSAVLGRIITGVYIDRLNPRPVSSVNFLTQAIALSAMIMFHTPTLLYIAGAICRHGVGNTTSLPGLMAQRKFPKEHFGKTITLIVAFNQFALAFSPAGLGVLRNVRGTTMSMASPHVRTQRREAAASLFQ